MAVPTYDRFIEPVLRFLATKPEGALTRDAQEAAANQLGLSEAQQQEKGTKKRGQIYFLYSKRPPLAQAVKKVASDLVMLPAGFIAGRSKKRSPGASGR